MPNLAIELKYERLRGKSNIFLGAMLVAPLTILEIGLDYKLAPKWFVFYIAMIIGAILYVIYDYYEDQLEEIENVLSEREQSHTPN
ncbi:MAG: hypothetical protein FIB07_13485 [Candidatus Methanoperedens sp.]|nr:hypothetical protein [Candidatus Methanoperedens sp.]